MSAKEIGSHLVRIDESTPLNVKLGVAIAVLFFFMGVTWTIANWKNGNDQSIATNTKDIAGIHTKLDSVDKKIDRESSLQIAAIDKLDQIAVFLGMPGVNTNVAGQRGRIPPVTQK